jgi:soluble lytic murein transglycosylase-like protein
MRYVLGVVWLSGLLWAIDARPLFADIYRYVDADGVVHYTNIQPNGSGWRRVYRTNDAGGGGNTNAHRWSPERSEKKVDPDRLRRFDAHIREAAELYQLPEPFIRAVMLVESNFYPDVVSVDGAMGLMQLMPSTAANMGVLDAFDPRQNVLGGTRFLRVLANRFNGDLVLTVAAYNAGEAAVGKYGGVPPYAETRRYVQRVLSHYYRFRDSDNAAALAAR